MRRSHHVILAAILLDATGIGIVLPILPGLLRELGGDGAIAFHYGALLAAYALMQLAFAPVLGILSDRFGRRPVLLISLAGAALDYVLMAYAPTLAILYVGRVIAGITGANIAVATAYIADSTTEGERARYFGYMNACFGLGLVGGPLLGGFLGEYWLRAPFLAAAVLNGLNFLVGWFALPESLPAAVRAARKPFALATLNPFASFRWAWSLKAALPFIAIFFLLCLVGQVPASLWVIYGQDRFGWGMTMVGASLAAFGLLHALSQAFVTGPAARRLGERRAVMLGIVADGAAYLFVAFATAGWMLFALIPLFCLGGVAVPALQALISAQAGADKQGEMQGALASLNSLTAIVGPLAATAIYAASQAYWPGLVWLLAAGLYLFCLPLLRLAGRAGRPAAR